MLFETTPENQSVGIVRKDVVVDDWRLRRFGSRKSKPMSSFFPSSRALSLTLLITLCSVAAVESSEKDKMTSYFDHKARNVTES